MSVAQAPQFRASPAPSEEEAAAIAAALTWLLDQEAAATRAAAPPGEALSPWVADSRGTVAGRGVADYRAVIALGSGWRLSGRAPVWGTATVQR